MKQTVWLILLSFLSFSHTAEDIALRAEKKLHALQSIQADFNHIYYSSSVSIPLREKGKFFFKKPDLMKWEYKDPEEKIFLYKKGIFLLYIPEDNQLIRSSLSKEKYESEILSLLSGQKRLTDNYSIELSPFPSERQKAWQLKLTSKGEDDDYSHILLEIDEKTWLIRKAIFFDWAGNKTVFQFSRIKTNVKFSEEVFELKVPPGVEIIEDESYKKKYV